MGRASSPARRRGSSAGKAKSAPPETEKLPTWDDDALPSPSNPANKRAYGDLLSRYDGLPDRVKQKLIASELTGRAFNLRMSDIVPAHGLKLQVSGELYDELQKQLDAIPNYTSLDFLRTLLRCNKLPISQRFEVAKEMLPYEHTRNPAPAPKEGDRRAALVIPGALSLEDWEKLAAQHREHTQKLERDFRKGT